MATGFCALACEYATAQTLLRVGSELQVNTYTLSSQYEPALDIDGEGNFVVVWQQGSAVTGRRFNATGVPQGAELQVGTYTSDFRQNPAVALDEDGDFVVVWRSRTGGNSYGILARRFNSTGVPEGSAFQVNTYTGESQGHAAIDMEIDGDFVVVWASSAGGLGYDILARRFSSSGFALASEFQVNSYTTFIQWSPKVSVAADGDFVVVWESNPQDGSGAGIFGQRFDSTGSTQGAEFQINTYTQGRQAHPALAVRSDGGFVVSWVRYVENPGNNIPGNPNVFPDVSVGISARRFDGSGSPLSSEFAVSSYTDDSSWHSPGVAIRDDGDFIVIWHENAFAPDHLLARHFDGSGLPQSTEFRVGSQVYPVIGGNGAGDFVVASQGQDGSGFGIFAQRLAILSKLDADGDGATEPLMDGLLVLRYLFGFRGEALTTGVVGDDCTRCDAAAIEAYLLGLGPIFDVDGDGSNDPLSDGLLTMRYLFGMRGASLIEGCVRDGCTRCDAPLIENYLAGLTI